MIAPPSRTDHLRRLVAWVLGLDLTDVADMSEDRAYRILAGERRHDAGHLETLRSMSTNALGDEAPFARAFWLGTTPTPEDHARRVSVAPMTPTNATPRWANTDAATDSIGGARATAPTGNAPLARIPEPPRATPDELREILKRAELHTPRPTVGLR